VSATRSGSRRHSRGKRPSSPSGSATRLAVHSSASLTTPRQLDTAGTSLALCAKSDSERTALRANAFHAKEPSLAEQDRRPGTAGDLSPTDLRGCPVRATFRVSDEKARLPEGLGCRSRRGHRPAARGSRGGQAGAARA
jgi:hypothetical protein